MLKKNGVLAQIDKTWNQDAVADKRAHSPQSWAWKNETFMSFNMIKWIMYKFQKKRFNNF